MNNENQTGQLAFNTYLWACGGLGFLFLSVVAQTLYGFLIALVAGYVCVYGCYHNYWRINKSQPTN